MKQAKTLDGRDFTKAPPAELDIQWVIVMRRRLVAVGQDPKPRAWPYGWEDADLVAAQ